MNDGPRESPMVVLARTEGHLEAQLERAEEVPTREELARTKRQANRHGRMGVAISALLGAVAILISIWNTTGVVRTETAQQLNSASIDSLKEANKKLEARGLPSIPVPQPGQDVDTNALVQAAAALVLADVQTDPRYRGQPGATVTGPPGAPCDPAANPACRGPEGQTGQPGVSGASGAPGAPCDPAIRPECQGPPGIPGVNGQNGNNGNDGNPGQGFDPNNRPHFEGTKSNCEFVLTYVNPAGQDRIPWPGGPCPDDPVVTTEVTPTEGTP